MTSGGPKVAGYVLAGGASSRFGVDKALVALGGKPMLQRMCELIESVTASIVVITIPGRYEEFGWPVVADRWPGAGPLGGIATALLHSAESAAACGWSLIVGCDLPLLTRQWLEFLARRAEMSAAQVVIPRSAHGYEPLCACYHANAATAIVGAIQKGERKIARALQTLHREELDARDWKRFDTGGRLFCNMNTRQEYEAIRELFSEETA